MKKIFFLLAIMATASGCVSIAFFPTLELDVYNACQDSTLYIKAPGKAEEMAVLYGDYGTVKVTGNSRNNNGFTLSARGFGYEGVFLGTNQWRFYLPYSGSEHRAWHINYLQNGERSCRDPAGRKVHS